MKKGLKVAVDIDNILHDWYWLAKREAKRLGYVIPEAPKNYKFTDDNKVMTDIVEVCHSDSNILGAIPLPGSIWALNKLRARGADIDFVTNRDCAKAEVTEQWLKQYYSGCGKCGRDWILLCCRDKKDDALATQGYDFIIDDKPETLAAALLLGIGASTLVYPWNAHLVKKDRRIVGAYNWIDLYEKISEKFL